MNTAAAAPAEPTEAAIDQSAATAVAPTEPAAVTATVTTTTIAAAVEAAETPGGVLGGRERIDAIDAEIIALIQRRMAVSAQIQAARMTDGGRRLDLRRETEVIGRYTRPLGRPGTSVAMALLELGRGRV